MSDVIKLLPDSVANQIAAGEVIQRPASVIKELVENAVDAGADNISIILKDAGRTLIQVVDNGKGMSPTDARMAFERHATSKISSADDLFSLHTMGFRGEALASICAVAQVDVRTMPREAKMGTRLVINGSKVESQQPEACVPGTNMMVKNLFFNVPARRKFLKKDSVELNNILREFERLALVNTDVEFTLIHNDVTLYTLRRGSLLRRISELFGKNLDKQLIPIETDTPLVKLSGYISLPEHARKRNQMQFLFVNGRNMRHPYFRKAVLSCYENLISPEVEPNFFINFEVKPDTIDVNIHPTKSEIKFENELPIRQILVAAVRESLGRYNAGPSLDFEMADAPEIPVFAPDANARHEVPVDPTYNPFRDSQRTKNQAPQDWEKLYENFNRRRDDTQENVVGSSINRVVTPTKNDSDRQGELELDFDHISPGVIQIKNRFIVTPCREGLMVIDQNRAHRRVLYERFLSGTRGVNDLTTQQVIFPEKLHLSPAQESIVNSLLPDLERVGYRLSPLGNGEWSIAGTPSAVTDTPARDMVLEIIDGVIESGEEPGDNLRRQMAASMARATAVRPGQPLSAGEMDRLMAELFALPSPAYTPDGQRIFTIISTTDIVSLLS